jgi:hypothetical protein
VPEAAAVFGRALGNEGVCHLNHVRWTSEAVVNRLGFGSGIGHEHLDSFGVRVPESIDGLVVITNDT